MYLQLYCGLAFTMSVVAKGESRSATASPGLQPSVDKDSSGVFIAVTCGSVSGRFYTAKFAQSKKAHCKCVFVNGKWCTPSEVEALAGKKAKKWRQSLLHLGKPLSSYDLSGCQTQVGAEGIPDNSPDDMLSDSTLISDSSLSCGQEGSVQEQYTVHPHSPTHVVGAKVSNPGEKSATAGLSSSESVPDHPVTDPVLAFVKAFRLKGDVDSLKRLVSERFSSELVDRAKKALWDCCGSTLVAASLPFQPRRDSDRRSQLVANFEDILKAFEILDSTDSIPPIFCEASDLLKLPPLSLDPIGEQVQANTQTLLALTSSVNTIEDKITSLVRLTGSLSASNSSTVDSVEKSASYAQVASSLPSPPTDTMSSSIKQPPRVDTRESNVVLFGVPEQKSIVETKAIVDEVFEFLAGKPVLIKDIFRLGKYSPSSRPRPLLIKLLAIWDRKLLLARKRNLRDFKVGRLFLREDVPPDHKLRQGRPRPPTQNVLLSPTKVQVTSEPSTGTSAVPSGVALASEGSKKTPSVSLPSSHACSPSPGHPPSPLDSHTSTSLSPLTVAQGEKVQHNGSS